MRDIEDTASSKPRKKLGYHHGSLDRTIREIALRLVDDGGPEAFTMSAVARTAGVSPAACYRHYSTREDLFTALAADAYEILFGLLKSARSSAGTDPVTRLTSLTRAYLKFADLHPNLLSLLFGPDVRFTETDEVTAIGAAVVDMISNDLRQAIPGISVEECSASIRDMWIYVHGAATLKRAGQLRLPHGPPISLRDLEDAATALLGVRKLRARQ